MPDTPPPPKPKDVDFKDVESLLPPLGITSKRSSASSSSKTSITEEPLTLLGLVQEANYKPGLEASRGSV